MSKMLDQAAAEGQQGPTAGSVPVLIRLPDLSPGHRTPQTAVGGLAGTEEVAPGAARLSEIAEGPAAIARRHAPPRRWPAGKLDSWSARLLWGVLGVGVLVFVYCLVRGGGAEPPDPPQPWAEADLARDAEPPLLWTPEDISMGTPATDAESEASVTTVEAESERSWPQSESLSFGDPASEPRMAARTQTSFSSPRPTSTAPSSAVTAPAAAAPTTSPASLPEATEPAASGYSYPSTNLHGDVLPIIPSTPAPGQ